MVRWCAPPARPILFGRSTRRPRRPARPALAFRQPQSPPSQPAERGGCWLSLCRRRCSATVTAHGLLRWRRSSTRDSSGGRARSTPGGAYPSRPTPLPVPAAGDRADFLSRVPTFRDAAFPSAHLHSATKKLPLLGFQLCTLSSPKRRLTAPLCLCLCAGRTRSLRCVRRPARVSARPAPSHHRSQSRDRETKRRRRSNAVGRSRRRRSSSRRRAVRGGGSGRRTYQFILLYIGTRHSPSLCAFAHRRPSRPGTCKRHRDAVGLAGAFLQCGGGRSPAPPSPLDLTDRPSFSAAAFRGSAHQARP